MYGEKNPSQTWVEHRPHYLHVSQQQDRHRFLEYSGQKNCSNVGHFGKDYIIVLE